MNTTLGIVQAWSAGGGKNQVSRRLGGKSLLEWVVRRMTDCQRIDQVLVVADAASATDWHDLVPADVPIFPGTGDPLANLVAALEHYPSQAAVLLGCEAPFVDPVLIDRLVTTAAEHPACDYIGYCSRTGQTALRSSVGILAEWVRTDALRRAQRECQDASERRPATRYLYSHPELFGVRLIPAPEGLDRPDVRLTIHCDEDWEHAQTILEALGPEALDWQKIAGLLERQPALRRKMAVLNAQSMQA